MAKKARRDPEREQRIIMEIVVDAYGEDERAMGWYYVTVHRCETGAADRR